MKIIRAIILAPLSWLYALTVWVRNMLYREHIFISHSVSIPTICVGNLAVGGTGKTPMTEYIISHLQHDYKIAVLSRGYRRKTHGFVLADDKATALTIGDEPMQIHMKFPNIPVAVSVDRVAGIKRLQKLYPDLQCIILDDAYQHRSIRCGYYILLTQLDNLYIDDHYLPWGTLRDNRIQSLRANMMVITKCPEGMFPIDKRIIANRLNLPSYQHLYFSSIQYPEMNEQGTPLVVTGIANPQPLMDYVTQFYPSAVLMAFPDHHHFTPQDIHRLEKDAEFYPFIITTEKDMARLRNLDMAPELAAKLHPLAIGITMSEEEHFFMQLKTYINENIR